MKFIQHYLNYIIIKGRNALLYSADGGSTTTILVT